MALFPVTATVDFTQLANRFERTAVRFYGKANRRMQDYGRSTLAVVVTASIPSIYIGEMRGKTDVIEIAEIGPITTLPFAAQRKRILFCLTE